MIEMAELNAVEEAMLAGAEQLDSGTLAERLADTAHAVAYAPASAEQLRELAALALVCSRRVEQSASGDD